MRRGQGSRWQGSLWRKGGGGCCHSRAVSRGHSGEGQSPLAVPVGPAVSWLRVGLAQVSESELGFSETLTRVLSPQGAVQLVHKIPIVDLKTPVFVTS